MDLRILPDCPNPGVFLMTSLLPKVKDAGPVNTTFGPTLLTLN